MRQLFSFFAVLTVLLFMLACSGGKKETVYDYPDDDTSDIDISDIDISDIEISDNDSDDSEISDIETSDEDSDTDTEEPEPAENHKISGILQAGSAVSNVKATLFECGKDGEIATADTDADGKFSFSADMLVNSTYCVKANGFASCFIGWKDHTANISEITNAAYLLDENCADIRKSETKVRNYAKLGTGEWLGELDYSQLSGIKEGLKLLSSFLNTNDPETLSEKIAADVKKTDGREFEKFFDGFKISADKNEVVIDTANPANNKVSLSIEGGSSIVAEDFKIVLTVVNETVEAATHEFKSVVPGEYTVRAKLVSGEDAVLGGDPIMISEDSSTILFLLEKSGGTIDVSDMTKDISHYIDNGIYAVIPKNTVIKKDGNKVNQLTYKILTAGDGSQISKINFEPAGATFTQDSLYFVYELGTVFGGDPIMLAAKRTNADGSSEVLQSAGGDPIMLTESGNPMMFSASGDSIMEIARSAGGDPIMFSAGGDPIMMDDDGGDPIMQAAGGDPIMTSAAGDPIMSTAAGDPIMLGTSSSVMVAKTDHFSGFLLNSTSLPVSVEAIVSRWCDGSYYQGYSPIKFIKTGVEKYKSDGADKTELLSYLDCSKIGDLGSDLYELMNKQIGYQRNLNLFENIYYVSEFHNRMLAKANQGETAAVKNGLELRAAIASLYTATTSLNRSSTLADLFDSSKIPTTYSGVTPEDYSSFAQKTVTGLSEIKDKYVATKKEMMIFANYIMTSSKGPDFSGITAPIGADQFVCAWFEGTALECDSLYTLNENGHVAINGSEISVENAEKIFAKYFMPMNSRLSNDEKLDLFRTYFLALRYIGTIFRSGESTLKELNDKLFETAYLVFDGINRNANAVSIVDTFDASANTVQVVENGEMSTVPYLSKLSSLTGLISLDVATEANVEKVLIKTEGYAYEKVTENTRTYYKTTGELKENSIILTPGTLSVGLKPLKELIGSNDVDSLGNITGKMTVVVNSKISGKTYSTQKTYEFFINSISAGVDSKPLPSELSILIHDASGNPVNASKNPGIILNPGGRTYYPNADGEIKIGNLAPASYTIDAFADGYYAKTVGVNLPENATLGLEIRLDEEITSSNADAALTIKVNINTVKHPDKVYIQIYDEDMELVANESAKFNETSNGYDDVNISINFGRYTLLAVGEEMYNYIEAITVNSENTVKEITVVAKNACGNGIIDAGEECETGDLDSTTVRCGDIFTASANPDNNAVCNKTTCVYDKAACGAQTYSNCGDGIIDPGEGCDGGTKACSEIESMGTSAKGTAPCKADCSDWNIAGNCSKTTESCTNLPEHAIWNDGTGRFNQTWNGSEWLPSKKDAAYGTTRDECVFSCDKGYKWDNSNHECLAAPLSLGNICTGQTDCFDNSSATAACPAYGSSFFGQDAQYALVGYCTEKSFSQKGTNPQFIVVDDFTHYEWHKVSGGAQSWDAAEEYCRTSTYGGTQLHWKLPTPEELLTIVDSGRTDSPLADIFTTSGHTFWANEDNRNSENAWRINENGTLMSVAKSTENDVICIHVNDYDAPAERFTAAEETVTDNVSGLIWQKQYASSKSWAEALSYCEDLTTSGHYDWRLPNRNELATLLDFTGTSDVASGLSSVPAQSFWTSTTSANTPNAAWIVDFADGSITAETKSETNYVLCVRSENECIGSDCVDACDFEPCRNIKNSTGVCTATGGTFICGCKSRFHWNNSRCELDTVLHSNCDLNSLPKHGHWNIYSSIDQTCDDEDDCDWYPSLTGQYNETPNPNECRFVCNTDKGYVWNGDDCVGKTQLVNCESVNELPDNAQWHDSGMIVQQWVCNDLETICNWDITTDAAFSEDPVDNRCRYKCNEHYSWKNSSCVADEQPATCDGLADNATWWNTSITQTWNGSDWAPSKTGTYSKTSVDNECAFKCNSGFFWDGSTCVSPCSGATNPCSGVANSNGVCTATSTTDYSCGCNDGYYWWDNQGCIERKPVALGNICTITEGCYDTVNQMACPAESEDFYGQPSQYAAKGTCVARSFSDNNSVENEPTLLDNNIGLEWQKNFSSAFDSQETALEYCENLEYGGHSDWRLPTQYEMMTVFDYSQRDIVIKPAYTEYFYWTSTVISDEDGALVWASGHHKWFPSNYTFYDGYADCGANCGYEIPSYKFAFCVRGKELPAADFVVSSIEGDEIVKDRTTGLMWQKTSTVTTWKDALSYCENLDYAGFSDWRLPNTNEWASNDDIYNPAPVFEWITGEGGGYWFSADTPVLVENETYYWSVSAPAWNASAPLVPIFNLSYKTSGDYEFKVNVRCVRSGLCGEGEFWNGSECVTPCSASSCGGGAEAECVPTSYDSYKCECHNAGEGYFWSGSTCINPCDADPCAADIPHSTHICTSTDWNKYSCGCDEGYFWDSTQCVPITLGRVCTGKNMCSNNSGGIACPSQGEDFFGQDWQYAKEGFCAPRSFRAETVSGDEIIIDDKLGLEWQRLHYPTSPTDINRVDWYYAVDYCNDLVYAGHNDWRLPSVKELFSLKYNPIDLALGDGQGLWTSQESGEDGAIVIFDSYYDSYHYKNDISKDELRAVRCVRGNKIPDADLRSSTVTAGGNNYEIVIDSTTRLIWQKNPEDSTKNWKNALADCENLEYAGLSNWRLPNNNELMSLINNDGSSNFPEISEATASDLWREFWTSSSLYEASGSAFVLYSFGAVSFESKTGKYYAVCVHSNICKDGEFWDGSACVNPCEPNPCATLANSTHECTATAWNQFECGCNDNFYWWGKERGCRSERYNLGAICTGLNKCFDDQNKTACPAEGEDYFGQDAQYAELGSCIQKSFSVENVSGQNIVVDNNTGLEWQQTISEDSYKWDDAATYCSNSTYAGKSDWRLPTKTEILTIFDSVGYNIYFMETDVVWTSSLKNSNSPWAMDFSGGSSFIGSKDGYAKYRCVRGDIQPEAEFHSSTMGNGDEIVADSTNHLLWQASVTAANSEKTWKQALAYCENLTYAGFSDWRVPNKNELFTLLNNGETTPASYFPNAYSVLNETFWSSSSVQAGNQAFVVDFNNADISFSTKSNSDKHNILCVRNDPCEEGKFWNGSACVVNTQCDSNPCGEHSTGCTATAWNKYECGCESGYFWTGSKCSDLNYSDTYGTLSLNFSVDRVLNSSDTGLELDQSDVFMGYFAAGTYGNSTASVVPANAATSYSYAFYADGNITIYQLHFNGSGDSVNPIFFLQIPEEKATVGTHEVHSINNENLSFSTQSISFVMFNTSNSEAFITCYHALGEGTITISNIGDFTNHGPLGFTGSITLYSPKNYNGYGDISSQLDYPACDPVE